MAFSQKESDIEIHRISSNEENEEQFEGNDYRDHINLLHMPNHTSHLKQYKSEANLLNFTFVTSEVILPNKLDPSLVSKIDKAIRKRIYNQYTIYESNDEFMATQEDTNSVQCRSNSETIYQNQGNTNLTNAEFNKSGKFGTNALIRSYSAGHGLYDEFIVEKSGNRSIRYTSPADFRPPDYQIPLTHTKLELKRVATKKIVQNILTKIHSQNEYTPVKELIKSFENENENPSVKYRSSADFRTPDYEIAVTHTKLELKRVATKKIVQNILIKMQFQNDCKPRVKELIKCFENTE